MAGERPTHPPYYLAHLSYFKRQQLYQFLDIGDRWKQLAAKLGHTMDKIDFFGLAFRRLDGSPSKEIIDQWSCRNPTFAELIAVLQQLNFVRAVDILLRDTVPQHTRNPGYEEASPRFVAPPEPPEDHMVSLMEKDAKLTSKLSELSMNKLDMFPPKEVMNIEPVKQQMNIHNGKGSSRVPVESPDASGHTSHVSGPKSFASSKLPLLSPQEDRSSVAILNGIQFRYAEIKEGTNNFDEDSIVGSGGFGVVYRAVLTRSNVAVKVLKKTNEPMKDWERFQRHLKDIINYRHENIIDFRGFSIDGPELCLVYNYMENGSLEDRLARMGGTPPLSWRWRHFIMLGASRGLQYLHTVKEKPLVHGDIKSANILLDEHFKAKIADFDEAREATGGSETGKYTHIEASNLMDGHVYGTLAYLPGDFVSSGCQFSIWTDIFSFGVVLFEVCTGQKAFDAQRSKDDRYLKNVMEELQRNGDQETIEKMKDRWAGDWPPEQYNSMVNLAYTCTKKRKKDRPSMPTVLSKLEQMEVENRISLGSASIGSGRAGQKGSIPTMQNLDISGKGGEVAQDVGLPAADPSSPVFDPRKTALPEDEGVGNSKGLVLQGLSDDSPLIQGSGLGANWLVEQDADMKRIAQKETTRWPFISKFEDVDNDEEDTLEYESIPVTLVQTDEPGQGAQDVMTAPPTLVVTDWERTQAELSSQHQGAAQHAYSQPLPSTEAQQCLYSPDPARTYGHSLDGNGRVNPVLASGTAAQLVRSLGGENDEARHQIVLAFKERKDKIISPDKN